MPEPVIGALALTSDPATFRSVRRWVIGAAQCAGLGDEEAAALAIALTESCANVYRHAYGGRRDGLIELTMRAEPGRVVTTVRHRGVPFDPARYAPPDLSRPEEGGYGMYLISRLVDAVSFHTVPGGGSIELITERRAGSGASARQRGAS